MSDTTTVLTDAEATRTSPWFRMAWATWLVVFVLTLLVIAVALTKEMQDTMPAFTAASCASLECDPFTFTAEDGAHLENELGWPSFAVRALARAIAVISSVVTAAIVLVSVFLVWQRPRDGTVLVVALALVAGNGFAFATASSRLLEGSAWNVPATLVGGAGMAALGALLFVFPTGTFVPRWTRWPVTILLGVFFVFVGLSSLYPDAPGLADGGRVMFAVFVAVVMVPGAISQVFRYVRVSTAEERQQTKWVMWALLLMLPGMLFWIVAGALYPLGEPGVGRLIVQLVMHLVINPIIGGLMPLAFAVAVLRYRLWDADVIINRTLVYAVLTLSLVGLYVGGILGLQAALRAITGQESNLAIVASTLGIAAVVRPLQRQIQSAIDRRLYRRKYNAERTLAAFGSRVRDEVELRELASELSAVVRETMQPAHVSLWLRPEASKR